MRPNSVIHLELQYLGDIAYLTKIANSELVILEFCEHFVKSSNRSRATIATSQGKQLLSIPVLGGRSHKQLYRKAQLDNRQNWQQKHWQAIKTAYGRAPYFDHYATSLLKLYSTKFDLLWDWNFALLQFLMKQFKIQTPIELSNDYLGLVETEGQSDFSLKLQQKHAETTYYQSFSDRLGYLSGLSALDLLLHLGPYEGKKYLLKLFS